MYRRVDSSDFALLHCQLSLHKFSFASKKNLTS
jgi:hypothetical protein